MDTTPDKTATHAYARPNRFERRATQGRIFVRRLRHDRTLLRQILMGGGVALVVVVGLFTWFSGGRFTGTSDAYVRAAQLLVSTDVSGLVASVEVKQGQVVKPGEVLFRLEPAQFQIALDTANSELQQAVLDLQAMKSDYARMLNDIAAQDAQVNLDQRTFDRAEQLVRAKNASQASYDEARLRLAADTQKLQSLKSQAEAQLAKLGGAADISPTEHPLYLKAKSKVDEAQRQLNHTVVRAPFDGVVTEVDSLQPGTLVVSALSSFSTTSAVGLVSSKDLWIEAQMKETDITHVHVGNPVTLTIDTYPHHHWSGTVDAVSPATGSSFAVLPAQNASGNWVKVVQRVAVRIKIDAKADDPPLRAGLSTTVQIDTGHRRWYRMLFG